MKRRKLVNNKFPIGSWVKCKNNDFIRYVTNTVSSNCFYDDGVLSKLPPSPYCHNKHYELFIAI